MRLALLSVLLVGCSPVVAERAAPHEVSKPPISSGAPVDLTQISERVSTREKDVGFDRLTIPEQNFHAIWTLEADVNNGGFDQYFFNSSGDYARVVPGALRAIGARRVAMAMERASQVFGAGGPPRIRTDRQQALAALSAEAKGRLDEAEKEFLAYPDDLGALLKAYVAANRSSFTAATTQVEPDTTEAAIRRLADPQWSKSLSECPADVFPGVEKTFRYPRDACVRDLDSCVERCQHSDASACYAAALRAQKLPLPMQHSEALFLQACRLGIASGCTNRAARIVYEQPQSSDAWKCGNRTFEAMCGRNDPWACTSWGESLAQGRWVKRDISAARKVLPKGCLLGEQDEACQRARRVLGRLR